MSIYEKLTQLQIELKAPKGQRNSFGNYNYRSAEDVLEAVKPLLEKYKLTQIISDEILVLGDGQTEFQYIENVNKYGKKEYSMQMTKAGQRYYVKSTVTLINSENPEEKISVTAFAREAEMKKGMDESQITGTASSYARKYALNGLYAIDDTKDSDSNEYRTQIINAKQENRQAQKGVDARNEKLNELMFYVRKAKLKNEEVTQIIKNIFNKNSSQDLTDDEIGDLIEYLKRLA